MTCKLCAWQAEAIDKGAASAGRAMMAAQAKRLSAAEIGHAKPAVSIKYELRTPDPRKMAAMLNLDELNEALAAVTAVTAVAERLPPVLGEERFGGSGRIHAGGLIGEEEEEREEEEEEEDGFRRARSSSAGTGLAGEGGQGRSRADSGPDSGSQSLRSAPFQAAALTKSRGWSRVRGVVGGVGAFRQGAEAGGGRVGGERAGQTTNIS